MSLKCFSMEPQAQLIFKTKTFGDKIIIKRPNSGLFNLILGEKTFHHFGVLSARNATTGDTLEIELKQKPFFSKPDTSCTGFIKDPNGDFKYKIEADWNTHFDIIDPKTNQKVFGMKKLDDLPNFKENYGMPLISRNANFLTKDELYSVCPTDGRFRSDQRAAEFGDYDLANQEKERLDAVHVKRREKIEKGEAEWQPRWFEKVFDEDVGKEIWTYKGGYFEARRKGEWENIPNIFEFEC